MIEPQEQSPRAPKRRQEEAPNTGETKCGLLEETAARPPPDGPTPRQRPPPSALAYLRLQLARPASCVARPL
eukprot:6799309-Lingulodinium_polyedra.AAC.1